MSNEDVIFVENLELDVNIGVGEAEREEVQPVLANFCVFTDTSAAARSGNLVDTIDYYRMAGTIRDYAESNSWKLLETLAEELCQLCLKKFELEKIELKLEKPAVLKGAATAGVQITRTASNKKPK